MWDSLATERNEAMLNIQNCVTLEKYQCATKTLVCLLLFYHGLIIATVFRLAQVSVYSQENPENPKRHRRSSLVFRHARTCTHSLSPSLSLTYTHTHAVCTRTRARALTHTHWHTRTWVLAVTLKKAKHFVFHFCVTWHSASTRDAAAPLHTRDAGVSTISDRTKWVWSLKTVSQK